MGLISFLNIPTEFALPHNLKNHYKTHLSQKDFVCTYCNKGFTQKINLQSHIRAKHTMEKPFICTVEGCDKAYPTRGELTVSSYTDSI